MQATAPLLAEQRRGRHGPELAVIDVGSNTARLVIFDTSPEGGFRAVYESKEVPRLGEGSGPEGALSPAAYERGVGALRRFARQIDAVGSPAVAAVATSAVRDAPNGRRFLDRVARETGLALKVLSGAEEARYGYLGVAAAWPLEDDLIVDLGGGSLQGMTTRHGQLDRSVSLPIGALRMTERFLEHDPPRRRELERLRRHVRRALKDVPLPRSSWRRLYGVGGSIRCLARVAISLRAYPLPQVHGYELRRRDLRAIESAVVGRTTAERREIPGISGHRADVLPAALYTVEELLDRAGVDRLIVSGTGIREGIVVERLGIPVPMPPEVLAYRSATALARAFGFSLAHGEELQRFAGALFDLLVARRLVRRVDRLSLNVAAWLHDMGSVVEIGNHAVHSAYLMRHASVLGLDHRELLIAALAASLHEGERAPRSWRDQYRPLLKAADVRSAVSLGTVLFVIEALDGAQVRFALPHRSRRLYLRPQPGAGNHPSARTVERIRRAVRRTFDLEVVVDA